MIEPNPPTGLGVIRIEQEVTIEASPERVWDGFMKGIISWWNRTFAAEHGIEMEPFVGGRFHEVWGTDQGAIYAFVTKLRRPMLIELTGALGLPGAVQGVATIELEPRGETTRLKLSHHVVGEVDESTRAALIGAWQDLLGRRLKGFVETGRPG